MCNVYRRSAVRLFIRPTPQGVIRYVLFYSVIISFRVFRVFRGSKIDIFFSKKELFSP